VRKHHAWYNLPKVPLVIPTPASPKLVGWSHEQEFESLLPRETLSLPLERWDPMCAESSNGWPEMGRVLELDTPAFECVTFSLTLEEVGRTTSPKNQAQPSISNLPPPAPSLWP
jgi:hypothetical protein